MDNATEQMFTEHDAAYLDFMKRKGNLHGAETKTLLSIGMACMGATGGLGVITAKMVADIAMGQGLGVLTNLPLMGTIVGVGMAVGVGAAAYMLNKDNKNIQQQIDDSGAKVEEITARIPNTPEFSARITQRRSAIDQQLDAQAQARKPYNYG